MKRFCIFFGLVVACICGCEKDFTGSVSMNKQNARVINITVKIGGTSFVLENLEQVDKIEKMLKNILVDIQYAKEQMEVKEKKH